MKSVNILIHRIQQKVKPYKLKVTYYSVNLSRENYPIISSFSIWPRNLNYYIVSKAASKNSSYSFLLSAMRTYVTDANAVLPMTKVRGARKHKYFMVW